jgi:BirA family biotin operon repressor/biotin-[acetyl-CoA-carboxylase] ligase
MSSDDRLDPDKIKANLKTARIGRMVVVYDRTASTNEVVAEYARNPDNDGLVVFAEEQTAGRGRRGAKWFSPRGESLLFSFALIGRDPGGELLSLTCAVAVAEAIGPIAGHRAQIKWPNDVLLSGRKIAGILVEARDRRTEDGGRKTEDRGRRAEDGGRWTVDSGEATSPLSGTYVVGIGINCHQGTEAFPPELREIATSIDLVSGTRCDRVTVAKRVLTSLDHWLTLAAMDKKRIIDAWSGLSVQLGHHVTLSYNRRKFTGRCIGIDPEKGLILQLDRGGVRIFDAVHTTIAKQ